MGNGKELVEAMSENGNIQLSSQNDYIFPSSLVVSESFPRADCCIPLCQRLRSLAFVRTSYNNNWCQRLRWLAFFRTSYINNWWLSSAWNTKSISPSEKCRIAYYPDATATRRILLLSGDIEVNPGWGNGLKKFDPTHVSKNQRSVGSTPPVISHIPVRISERRYSTHSYLNQHQSPTRISIKRVPFIKSSSTPLSLCLLNSRSVRNKSAAFFDYICECKADLVAVTETWLRCCDDAIRAELCLDGYKLLDHVRDCRQGGGTALLFRDSLTVK